jgi:lipopolysaccharide transport system ATP-binding protein
MALAIKVENLSKAYQLGEIGTGTLSRDLERWVAKVRGKEDPFLKIGEVNDRTQKGTSDIVWSLKDLNFEINQGDAVGVIGRNGAGKSTLLKILSRVTSPTRGSVKVKGRIASLLEVGTGFHPELTGRENIFLNGAILGMSKNEIKKKFDDIVDFSGVERYIDTPVKRFSSGMYVRLAFAVAAYLESEILIIDEVLAVGDAEFQKKCLGKIGDVSKGEGRTVLFVSHNMQAINTLCSHGIYLKNGTAFPVTSSREAVSNYMLDNEQNSIDLPILRDLITLHDFRIEQGIHNVNEYEGDKPIRVVIDFEITADLQNFRIGLFINNNLGELLNRSLLADWDSQYANLKKGRYRIKGQIPANFLVAGNYIFQVHSSIFGIRDFGLSEPSSVPVTILSSLDYNTAHLGEMSFGSVLIKQNWQVEHVL